MTSSRILRSAAQLLAGACLALWLQAVCAAGISEQLVVSGALKTGLTLSVADLKATPAAQIETVSVTRRAGDKEVPSLLRGVRLSTLLERAALVETDHNTWKHTVVLATATDGYQVVFSWPELFNTEVGAGVLVVFERDGQPLAEREGQIALVSVRDARAGPRSVKWLTRVEVRVLKD